MTANIENTGENWPDGEGPLRREEALLADPDLFRVDVNGFEGPLDMLLQLARIEWKVAILLVRVRFPAGIV